MQATLRVLSLAALRVLSLAAPSVLILALAAPATAAGVATGAGQPAAATAVSPPARLVLQSPGTIEFEILIRPTDQTDELRVVADSGTFYRSTTIGLAGADSQRVHTFEWRGFPAGEYDVVGELISASGRREVVVRGALLVVDPPEPRTPPAIGDFR